MRSQVEELLMQRTLCWESRDLALIPDIPLTPGVLPCLGMMRVLSKSDRKPLPPAWCTRRCFHVGVHLTGLHLLFPPWILQKHVSLPQLIQPSFWKSFLLEVLAVSVEGTLISHRVFSLQPHGPDEWFLLHHLPLAHLLQAGPVFQTLPARG